MYKYVLPLNVSENFYMSNSFYMLHAQKCFPNFLLLYDLVSINIFFYFQFFNLLKVLYTCTYTGMHIYEHNQFSSTCHVISFVFLSLRTVYTLYFNFGYPKCT